MDDSRLPRLLDVLNKSTFSVFTLDLDRQSRSGWEDLVKKFPLSVTATGK